MIRDHSFVLSSFRRVLGALTLAVSLVRVVTPDAGHTCASAPETVAQTAVEQTERVGARSAEGTPATHAAHAAHAAHATPTAPEAHSAHAAHGAAAHGAAAHDAVTPPSDSDESSTAPCDCAAWCCCVPSLWSPPTAPVGVVAVVDGVSTALPRVPHVVPATRAARLLPFATAPPANA